MDGANINKKKFEKIAYKMRRNAIKMAYHAGMSGAHLGGGLSCMEILAVLYCGIANISPLNAGKSNRDRILISKAHCVLAYYAALYEAGFLTEEDLATFEQPGSDFVGHPIRNLNRGIEFAGGSLGMALSVACGIAYDMKQKQSTNHVYVLLGDGECEEGSVWEACNFACKYGLSNLTAIIDRNHLQYDGSTEEIGGLSKYEDIFDAIGMEVCGVDGHDVEELYRVLSEKNTTGKPRMIVADTIKGKGISFMENVPSWHHGILNQDLYTQAMKELTGNDI